MTFAAILLLAAASGLTHADAKSVECFCAADFTPVCYKGTRYSNKCFAQCAGATDAQITTAPAGGGIESVLGCSPDQSPKSWPTPVRGLAAFVGVDTKLTDGTKACAAAKDLLQVTFGITCTTDLGSAATRALLMPTGKRSLRALISPRRRLMTFWKKKTWEDAGKDIGDAFAKTPKDLDDLGKDVGAVAEEVGKGFVDAGKAIKDAFVGVGKEITKVVDDAGNGIAAGAQNAAKQLDSFFQKAGQDFEKAIAELAAQGTLTAQDFEREFAKIGADFVNFFKDVGLEFEAAGKDFIASMEAFGKLFEKAITDILNGAGDLNGKAMKALLDRLTGTLRDVCPATCVAPGSACANPTQPACPPDAGCICTADVKYVCDNKGNLYSNACRAECAGYFGKLLDPIPGASAFDAPTCPDCHLYRCPAHSKRKPNRHCYDTFGDCDCDAGYTRNDQAGSCERDCVCSAVNDPVCWLGFIYSNACKAGCAGAKPGETTKPTPGASAFDEPTCPQDCVCNKDFNPVCWKGRLYGNACEAECAGAKPSEPTQPTPGATALDSPTCPKPTTCKDDFVCPSHSKRRPNRKCYDTVEDCYCHHGYEMKHGKCKCTNAYKCPRHSSRKPKRECYNNFDDCECDTGFTKDNGECERKVVTTEPCPGACKTCKDGGGSAGRDADPHCKYYCSTKGFCGVSSAYKSGTDCTRCPGGANFQATESPTLAPTNTPTIDRFVDTSLNPEANLQKPGDDGGMSTGAIVAVAIAGVAFLGIAGAFFYRMGKADGAAAPPDLKPAVAELAPDEGRLPVAQAPSTVPTDNNAIAQV